MINPRRQPRPPIFSVNRDKNFTHTSNNHVIKVPRYRGFSATPGAGGVGQIGNEPGMEGDVILDRNTRLLCYHNGFTWVCLGGGGVDTTTLTGLCPGDGDLVVSGVGPNLSIKGLTEGSGITLTPGANCVTISATGAMTTLDGLCPGDGDLVVSGVGPNLSIRGLEAGPGITLDPSGTCITIGATGAMTTLTGLCPGEGDLVVGDTGPNLSIKGITAGDGIMLTGGASCVEIINDSPASSVTLDNLCTTGETLVVNGTGPNLTIKGISAGDGIMLTGGASCVEIINDSPATSVTLDNLCTTGETLVVDGTGPNLTIKGLTAGDGITLTGGASCIEISNDSPATSVTLDNLCTTGETLVVDGTGPNLTIKGITAGDGITLTGGASCVEITNDSPATSVTLDNLCSTGETLVVDGTGPNLTIKGLTAGDGITLTGGASCVEISNDSPATSVTLDNLCSTGETLVVDGTGPNLSIKGLSAGDGITLTGGASCVEIINDSPASSVTLDNLCTTGETLVVDGTGPNLSIKGLSAGDGITLTGGASCVEIINDSPASSVTLDNLCTTGETLVVDGTGPNLSIKGLSAGDGIMLTGGASCVEISALGSAITTLTNLCPDPGESLVVEGTGPNLTIKGLSAGDGIILTGGASCVEISAPGAAITTLTNLCTDPSGESLVVDGTGPDLTIKGLTPGSNITLSSDASCVTITGATTTLTSLECSPPFSPPNEVDLVVDGTGPSLVIRKLNGGAGISLDTDNDCVNIKTTTSTMYNFPTTAHEEEDLQPFVVIEEESFTEVFSFIYRGDIDAVTTAKIIIETSGGTATVRIFDETAAATVFEATIAASTSKSINTLTLTGTVPTVESIFRVDAEVADEDDEAELYAVIMY